MKTYYRFFGAFLDTQEAWLNEKAAEGLRLVKTGKSSYTFEPCEPGAYSYRVEFTGGKPYGELMGYKSFLEEAGYRVLTKNLNLDFAFGKVRWRPWGEGSGQVATSFGGYGKELFLVEKKNDGQPWALHTDLADQAAYVRRLRNMHLTGALACLAATGLLGWRAFQAGASPLAAILCGTATLVMCLPLANYASLLGRLTREGKLRE